MSIDVKPLAEFTCRTGSEVLVCQVESGKTVFQAMQELGMDISFPCNGKHLCGKCKVWVKGDLSPVTAVERRMLGDQAPEDLRLACFSEIQGDVEVTLPDDKRDSQIALRFSRTFETVDPNFDGDYGFAVDIGTTTIAAYLFVRDSHWSLAYDGDRNQQQRFGADVLSRIDYSNRNGYESLTQTIRRQLSDLFLELCHTANVSPEKVGKAVITGNTVMLHLLAGLDPRPLAEAPFNMVSSFGEIVDWRIDRFPQMEIYLVRCMAAYLGGDITCSVLVTDLLKKPDGTILIDIGTNGEMVLKAGGKLIACSTAAGPAFESAGISSGISAKAGAISKVWSQDGRMHYATIEDQPAIGVCGSGLIDAVSVANELKLINTRGKILDGKSFEIGDSGIHITQKDVRQLQMAKAALRAGIDTLMEEQDMNSDQLSEIILCGGFGSYLDPESAIGIGMIPAETAGKSSAFGNGAGGGASMILLDKSKENESIAIAEQVEVVELSYNKSFPRKYIEAMYFPELND